MSGDAFKSLNRIHHHNDKNNNINNNDNENDNDNNWYLYSALHRTQHLIYVTDTVHIRHNATMWQQLISASCMSY